MFNSRPPCWCPCKAVHNFLPAYTWRKVANLSLALDTDDCVRRTPTRAYCSESTHVLEDRSFAVAGPRVWNSIAARVRHHTRISTSTQNASIWSQTAAAPSDSVFCAVYKLAYLLTYLLTVQNSQYAHLIITGCRLQSLQFVSRGSQVIWEVR